MRKILLGFCFLFIISFVSGQEDNGARIILKASKGDIKNSFFHVYTPSFKAKVIYKDTIQAVNKYPEQLMSSIMSENNETWYYYNNLEKKEISPKIKNRFNRVNSLDKDKNYFELLHKFQFESNGKQYAFIKFRLILENKKPSNGAYSMVKINGKWKKTSSSDTFKMTMMNVFFRSDRLQEVFKGKKGINPLMDSLIDIVYNNGVLDMEKLLNEFEKWNKNNEVNKLEYFTENPNWKN